MALQAEESSGTRRRLLALVTITYGLAAALVAVETYRSWGVGRPVLTVADDYVGAALLAWAAWLTRRPGERARRAAVAIWGVICGVSLCNFSVKLLMPDRMTPGNLPPALLQALVGGAFVLSLIALIATILLPSEAAQDN
jgi:Na+/melibiose symporter-like transporter